MENIAPAAALQPRLVSLIGGAGFLGTAIAEHFLRAGWRVRIACRDLAHTQHMRTMGDVGQIAFVRADVSVPRSLVPAVVGADAVINLVGILDEKGGQRFDVVQAEGAGHVAEAARAAGAGAFVHISAIGADADSASAYGRSKAGGEARVQAAFPGAAIVRPSIIFGPEDSFTNRFAGLMTRASVMPVVAAETRLQPVYVQDVAAAVLVIVGRLLSGGTGGVYELGGPDIVTMRAVLASIAAGAGRNVRLVDVPDTGARLLAGLGSLPGAPLTRDQYLMLKRDNVATAGHPGLAELGITPTSLAGTAPAWLARYRPGGRFAA